MFKGTTVTGIVAGASGFRQTRLRGSAVVLLAAAFVGLAIGVLSASAAWAEPKGHNADLLTPRSDGLEACGNVNETEGMIIAGNCASRCAPAQKSCITQGKAGRICQREFLDCLERCKRASG